MTNDDDLGGQVLILCDEAGTPAGYAPRDACHAGDGLLHRAVFVVLVDPDGNVLLQRRRSALWDGAWDFAGATHPLHTDAGDESDADAAARCVRIEWGVDVPLVERFAFTYHAHEDEHAEREYCVVFTGTASPDDIAPNPEYAYAADWEPPHVLWRRMDEDPALFTPWAHRARPRLEAHPEWLR